MKKGRKNKLPAFFLVVGLPILVCGVLLWLSFVGIRSFLINASYFQVKKVTFIGLDEKKTTEEISKKLMYDSVGNYKNCLTAKNSFLHSKESHDEALEG